MITAQNSNINGFHFEHMVNGVGEGICENCNTKVNFTSFYQLQEYECKCKGTSCDTKENNR